jgi:hypothetical protein
MPELLPAPGRPHGQPDSAVRRRSPLNSLWRCGEVGLGLFPQAQNTFCGCGGRGNRCLAGARLLPNPTSQIETEHEGFEPRDVTA